MELPLQADSPGSSIVGQLSGIEGDGRGVFGDRAVKKQASEEELEAAPTGRTLLSDSASFWGS